jgi:hypothetical protein
MRGKACIATNVVTIAGLPASELGRSPQSPLILNRLIVVLAVMKAQCIRWGIIPRRYIF